MNKVQKAGLALAAGVAGLTMAVAPAGVAAADSGGAGILSATGCHGTTCIYVNGKGLTVSYAVVTNKKGSTVGRGMISSNWDGATHTGPRLKKGQSWRFDYNRQMNNGNKVCGSIEGIDVACVTIHK
ncbi:hypothetical protein [Streptomyces sp. XH2]|uniref:hypothetical protein n=1 Tax=Streptomyces sp. XH2 TaxID=3412483 RepID=UPI003C7A21E0